MAAAREGCSRQLAAVEHRLRAPLRHLARWGWMAPLLLTAGVGVWAAGLGRGRRPPAAREKERNWLQGILRTTLVPVLLRGVAFYLESRLLALATGGRRRQETDSLRRRGSP